MNILGLSNCPKFVRPGPLREGLVPNKPPLPLSQYFDPNPTIYPLRITPAPSFDIAEHACRIPCAKIVRKTRMKAWAQRLHLTSGFCVGHISRYKKSEILSLALSGPQ
ncbi:hypothetical protein HRR80_005650 [Exophiala dermatitidis]|uniref:Uncharacterized protein n=1 Tax=Exophiala dermatitidis TaxID=5970 RepID=A0AAN6EUJ4_EXODE|nr:hypothetical protein HRR80_005650 [Exophiala dermatitidis]